MLTNAQHIKQVPGRMTAVKDCQWIARLLQHGLLKPSLVPAAPTSVHKVLQEARQRHKNPSRDPDRQIDK